MTSSIDLDEVWIYHELQQSLLCGQHAINNLAQGPVFSAYALAEIAHQLDEMELAVFAQNNEGGRRSKEYLARLNEGSQHVNASGYFSLEVLLAAVQNQFAVSLIHSSQCTQDFASQQGFLCHKSDHWFAIRMVGGRFWDLNSTKERPTVISHFTLATDIEKWQKEGYTVYCVASGLPVGGVKPKSGINSVNGGPKANWHRASDLLRGKSTGNDPWEGLSGAGIRLDGGAANQANNASANNVSQAMLVEGLTEEEMLQMALQASMEPQPPPPQAPMHQRIVTATSEIEVPLEPVAGTPGAVRIQIKMPNQPPLVRRFLASDIVEVVYAFVEQHHASNNRPVELRCGFPPKDLSTERHRTIEAAKLANQSLQGRLL